jgi:two-component system response regulator HydG
VLEGRAGAARPGCRVLMIDDDEPFLDLVGSFCTKGNHLFAGVGSSAAAIEALAGGHYDVLLVDLNIPGTSGEFVLRQIRAAGYSVPAIVLTGDVASADMDVLGPLGVVRVVQKSSRPEPLLQAIEETEGPQ